MRSCRIRAVPQSQWQGSLQGEIKGGQRKEEVRQGCKQHLKRCFYKPNKYRGLPAPPAGRRAGEQISLRASGGSQPCQNLDSELLPSRTVREYISSVLSHLGWGHLLQQRLLPWYRHFGLGLPNSRTPRAGWDRSDWPFVWVAAVGKQLTRPTLYILSVMKELSRRVSKKGNGLYMA